MNIEFQTKWELFFDLGGGGETGKRPGYFFLGHSNREKFGQFL